MEREFIEVEQVHYALANLEKDVRKIKESKETELNVLFERIDYIHRKIQASHILLCGEPLK